MRVGIDSILSIAISCSMQKSKHMGKLNNKKKSKLNNNSNLGDSSNRIMFGTVEEVGEVVESPW